MKWVLALTFLPCVAMAELGTVAIPPPPQYPSGSDSVQTSDGVRCSKSTAPRQAYMDIGLIATNGDGFGGSGNTIVETGNNLVANNYQRQGLGVYARVVINLDPLLGYSVAAPDCTTLLNLEIERLQNLLEYESMSGGVVGGVVK